MSQARMRTGYAGQAGSLVAIVIAVVGLLVLIGIVFFAVYIRGYNRAIHLDQVTNEAWANVQAQLQRRFDLVGNLVETVKGYATQEKEIFETVAQARTKYFQAEKAGSVQGQIDASNQLGSVLSRLLVLREAYPELKSNQNFLALQDQLEGTENRVAVARTRYNETVRELNAYVRSFLGSFFAARAGVETKPFFEAAQGAETAPKVDFSTKPPAAPAPQPAPQPAP
ncbi:MAG: LemA family protein [Sedimentisphaerales bacterium]|nr:LemA family protein [Sedimentisphaerales bacterium]